ncbi:hypothetical protein GCM10010345_18230 [Streptomyces canarius]|uniref:Uncharacterized protein n=1 Tax=Streptomyces canarius TaxID=285453 RepID=A0ABQ3CKR1_9ACTN|nr:hypothetical protein GCM10010345_18230 [Streptomyces canarius]
MGAVGERERHKGPPRRRICGIAVQPFGGERAQLVGHGVIVGPAVPELVVMREGFQGSKPLTQRPHHPLGELDMADAAASLPKRLDLVLAHPRMINGQPADPVG